MRNNLLKRLLPQTSSPCYADIAVEIDEYMMNVLEFCMNRVNAISAVSLI